MYRSECIAEILLKTNWILNFLTLQYVKTSATSAMFGIIFNITRNFRLFEIQNPFIGK